MNNSLEDLDNLECLDLNEIIEEKNKSQKNAEKKIQMSKSINQNENLDVINLDEEENPLFKLTKSINKDINNYIKESEEANLILTNNFTLVNKSTTKNKSNNNNDTNKNQEKESITDILKSTIKKSKHSQKSEDEKNSDTSLYDTLKIDEIKQQYEETQKSQSDSSIISNYTEGLTLGTTIFDGAVKIAKLLGEGAQAKVYLGIAEDNDEEEGENSEQLIMAIKHFSFDTGKQQDETNNEIDALVNKCQTLKELSHDNIIQYFDCESDFNEQNQNSPFPSILRTLTQIQRQ